MAMPSTAPVSTSAIELPTIADTKWPLLPVSSSVMVVSVGLDGVSTGASFSATAVVLSENSEVEP